MKILQLVVYAVLISVPVTAGAQATLCEFSKERKVVEMKRPARLVARIINPPKSRVTLSIDDLDGNHSEMVWDPAVNDGLQHSMLLKGKMGKTWRLSPAVEEERIQSPQMVILYTTNFIADESDPNTARRLAAETPTISPNSNPSLTFNGHRLAWVTISALGKVPENGTELKGEGTQMILTCEEGQVGMSSLSLNRRKVAAASAARGLLDQSIPGPVAEVVTLLAEVAVGRARSGAMELVRKRFVDPMCSELRLETLGFGASGLALPATCALVSKLRLEDVLSSGLSLVDAAKDDMRNVLAPALLDLVVTNEETRDLARIALDFGNRMIDGDGSSATAIDLLVALLDRLEWSSGFEKNPDLVFGWMKSLGLANSEYDALLDALVEAAVPRDVSDDPDPKWTSVPQCRRKYGPRANEWKPMRPDGTFAAGKYWNADRNLCVTAIKDRIVRAVVPPAFEAGSSELIARQAFDLWSARFADAFKKKYFDLTLLFRTLRARPKTSLQKTFAKYLSGYQTRAALLQAAPYPTDIPAIIENMCAVRLVVGVAKWCSYQESCSAGDIASAMETPNALFKSTTDLPEGLCWNGNEFVKPPSLQKYIDLGVRLVAFLDPPAKVDVRARALEMVKWMFAVVRAMNSGSPSVEQLESIISHLLEREYLRAMTETFALAEHLVCDQTKACMPPPSVRKALQLVGSVVSYLQIYDETKKLGAEEAKIARKKAIESLIDAATERHERHGDTIYSIGSPVGFALGLRLSAGTDAQYRSALRAYDSDFGFQWHLPLALARQRLPREDGHWDEHLGTHLAFWLGDLGQFARRRSDTDDITWKDFLGLGLQAGLVIGSGDHLAVLAAEASWSPGVFGREVRIVDGSTDEMTRVSGAFNVGITLAYYVPFFDLN